MKQKIIVLAMAGLLVTLAGCSSNKSSSLSGGSSIEPGSTATTPIAEQRLAVSDFKRNGVKIIYSLTGNVEAIEVTGYAPAWGGSHKAAREAFRAAELEAKKSLSDFIHKETITSRTSVAMISNNLEHAQDNTANKFATNKTPKNNNSDLIATDEDVGTTANENQAVRNNAVKIATQLRTTIVSTNRGILSGLYLKESQVIDDGKAVMVVMRWDKKHNDIRLQIGKMMAM